MDCGAKSSSGGFESRLLARRTSSKSLARGESEPKATTDLSVHGLKELSPLLRLAHAEGVGPLTPIPVASDRDLLNYGWEAAGLQMGARYRFVNNLWGVRELGQSIRQATRTAAEGWTPFFENGRVSKVANYEASLRRLELVEGLFQQRCLTKICDPLVQRASERKSQSGCSGLNSRMSFLTSDNLQARA